MDEKEMDENELNKGQKLLSAVERLVEHPEVIIELVEKIRAEEGEGAELSRICDRIVLTYARRCALGGGVTALPSALPGVGTIIALGGLFVDMTLMLRFEVEMSMALSYAFGFDITQKDEYKMALALASVTAADLSNKRSSLRDYAEVQKIALSHFAPREIAKIIMAGLLKRGLLPLRLGRFLPFVGIPMSASYNHLMTKRVGRHCVRVLKQRREHEEKSSVVVQMNQYKRTGPAEEANQASEPVETNPPIPEEP